MALRFGNALFEPLWRRESIANIQITLAEAIGVGTRGDFYDRTGALRDMIQNHALQLLTMIAMEPPSRNDADAIRDEKLKVLRSLKPFTPESVGARRGARPVPRRHGRRQARCPAYLEEAKVPRGQPHRDLRRAAHRGAELALGRRAVLPAHRQAAGRARRADRRQLPADAAHHLPGREPRRTSWSSSCSPRTASSCTCSPPRAPASSEALAPVFARPRLRQGLRREPRRRLRAPAARRDRRPAEPVRAQRRAGAGLALGRADPRRLAATTTPAPRPYAAGTWGPAAASALVARDGFAGGSEELAPDRDRCAC